MTSARAVTSSRCGGPGPTDTRTGTGSTAATPAPIRFPAFVALVATPLLGFLSAVAVAGLVWLLILHLGGAAMPVPGFAARLYPRRRTR